MKVAQLCYRFFPDRGGSETYTGSLILALQRRGVTSFVVAEGEPDGLSFYRSLPVYRHGYSARPSMPNSGDLGTGSKELFGQRVLETVRQLQPDIVHFHFRPGAAAAPLVSNIERLTIPTVFTYHHPRVTCIRGDLIRFGRSACSGVMSVEQCYPCVMHSWGAPRVLAQAWMHVPAAVHSRLASVAPHARLRTALGGRGKIPEALDANLAFLQSFSKIVVLSEWSRTQLIANGIPPSRILLSRLGTHHEANDIGSEAPLGESAIGVKGIFVGRIDRVKGIEVLLSALRSIADIPICIDVYGPTNDADPTVCALVARTKEQDTRMRFMGILPDEEVVSTMRRYDFAIVPSQSFETGPYVVIEAFQAGIGVIGSDLPAVNELVQHGVNGWLVQPQSIQAWADALVMVAQKPEVLRHWAHNARWGRSMGNVASEMEQLYTSLVEERRFASTTKNRHRESA